MGEERVQRKTKENNDDGGIYILDINFDSVSLCR